MDIGTPTRSSRQQQQHTLLDDNDTDPDSEGEEEIDDIFLSSPGYQYVSITYHQTEDEQIVNTALVNFLNALTLHFRLFNLWTLHRKAFRALFTSAAFEARTDGYLKDSESGKPRALVEVKAVRRGKKRAAICMQEAAQLVAWIHSQPDRDGQLNECGRRLHISQDHDQIYVILTEYNADYLLYSEGEPAPESFLTMHEFGPWDTRDLKSMKHFAVILVAIVLRAASDREVEERRRKSKAPAGQV